MQICCAVFHLRANCHCKERSSIERLALHFAKDLVGLGIRLKTVVSSALQLDRGPMLKTGTVVEATIIARSNSTKHDKFEHNPENTSPSWTTIVILT
jgi:hypothetical protein